MEWKTQSTVSVSKPGLGVGLYLSLCRCLEYTVLLYAAQHSSINLRPYLYGLSSRLPVDSRAKGSTSPPNQAFGNMTLLWVTTEPEHLIVPHVE